MKMKTSISEIKQFREDRRKWFFSGRNAMYLRSRGSSSALRLGSAFHDAMEYFYTEQPLDLNLLFEKYRLSKEDQQLLEFQLDRYEKIVLPHDLENYEIIEPEMHYNIDLTEDIQLFGFMDIVYRNKSNNAVGVLEHKFLTRPRPERYNNLEEQVKAYELAVREKYPNEEFDGVILNQVIKSEDTFNNIRTKHKQNPKQLDHFKSGLITTTLEMKEQAKDPIVPYSPHWASVAFDDYYPLNLKMDLLGTDDTRVITEEDIEKAGLFKVGG